MKNRISFGLYAIAALAIVAAVCGWAPAPEHSIGLALGGIIINQGNLANLFTGFKAHFNTGFRSSKPMWDRVATLVPSATKTEDYAWLGQFPKLREWIGDRQVKNLSAAKYSITNKPFEGTVAVNRDDIEDDQYGVYAPLFAEMGFGAAIHPDELVFDLLSKAFTTNCYDGQFMVDTDHPVGAGVVSNHGGGAGSAWFLLDTRRPLKPLIYQKRKDYNLQVLQDEKDEAVFMRKEYRYGVDARCNVGFGFWQQIWGSKTALDATNFDAGVAAMMAFKSDEGRPLGIMPDLLVVGPGNRAAAKALIEAEQLASGASNTNFKAVELYVCPWL